MTGSRCGESDLTERGGKGTLRRERKDGDSRLGDGCGSSVSPAYQVACSRRRAVVVPQQAAEEAAAADDQRRAECSTRPQLGRTHGIRFCRIYGCSTRGKTLLAESSCPLNRWDEVRTTCWFTAVAGRLRLIGADNGCSCQSRS